MADIVTLAFRVVANSVQARQELQRLDVQVKELAGNVQQIGGILSAAITLPLAALGAAAAKSAIDIDKQVNALKAFTGSAAVAEKRLAQLIETAQKTPGLTTSLAATLDAQLRVANVTEATINRILPAIGRLNAVTPLGDPSRFAQNIVQLVSQNFERADLKELVGNSPLAGELIKQVFNVDSPVNAEAIRASAQRLGIRTADQFFTALAEAAATNPKLANVTESISSQIEKLSDRIAVSLRPLGLAIIQAVTPIIETVVPFVEKLGQAFASLPQSAQTAIVVLGAAAAAIGPLAIGLGIAAQAVVAFAEAWAVLQAAMAAGGALASLPALLNPVTLTIVAIAAALGLAALAWASYEDAADRAAKLSVETIKSQQQEIDQLQSLQKEAAALAVSQSSSAEQHSKLQSILARLDPDTRAYISSISDEKTAIAELNRVLSDQVTLKQAGLGKNLADIGDAAGDLQERNAQLQQQLSLLDQLAEALARTKDEAALREVSTGFFGQPIESAEALGAALKKTKGDIDATKGALANFGAQVSAYINLNKLSIEAFTQQQLSLGRTREQVNGMIAAYQAFQAKQAESANSAAKTTSFIDQQRAAVDALIASLERLNQTANTQVDKKIREIALTSRNAAEAKAKLQEALKLDDDFFFAVQEKKRVEQNITAQQNLLNPAKGGSASRKLTAEQRAEASAQLKLLQQAEKEQELAARRQTEQLRRSHEDRLISARQFAERAIAVDQELLKAKLATLKEEEAAAVKAAKNKTDAEARRAEVQLRANQAILDSELRQEELRRQLRATEQRAEIDHQRRLVEIREISRKATETALKDAVSRGAIGAAEGEERLLEIERERFEEKKARLEQEFILAGANLQEQQRINGELAVLAAERAAFEEQASRRIQEAQAQSIRALRQFLQERRKIIEETAAAQVELLRQEADAARTRADLDDSPETRRAAIQAQLAAEVAAADLRHQLALRRIEDDRLVTVDAAGKNAGLVEAAEKASNDRRLAEDQRFQNERRSIKQQAQVEEQALDPSSNTSIFGVTDESISKLSAFGNAASAALAQVSAAAGNMRTILGGALSQVSSGLQTMLQSLILSGTTGPAALKKLAAGAIAAIASQSLVKAIFETAEGFAALARHDPAAAALHFKAAATYGVVGAIAGGIAAALSGGGADAGAGVGGASASSSAFDPGKQRELRAQSGNPFDETAAGIRETVSEGQGGPFAQFRRFIESVERLEKKITSMPPGDVVAVGATERPDAIASATLEATRNDAGFVRGLGLNLGLT
ncbi:MAG: hypothetical protein AB7U82_27665 [Blastocatellales bacterium]